MTFRLPLPATSEYVADSELKNITSIGTCIYTGHSKKNIDHKVIIKFALQKSISAVQHLENEIKIYKNISIKQAKSFPARYHASFRETGSLISGELYFIVDYLGKKNLQQVINSKQLEKIDALLFATELFRCIEWMHTHKIIHCDVKPSNFLPVGASKFKNEVSILDFGQSYMFDEKGIFVHNI